MKSIKFIYNHLPKFQFISEMYHNELLRQKQICTYLCCIIIFIIIFFIYAHLFNYQNKPINSPQLFVTASWDVFSYVILVSSTGLQLIKIKFHLPLPLCSQLKTLLLQTWWDSFSKIVRATSQVTCMARKTRWW